MNTVQDSRDQKRRTRRLFLVCLALAVLACAALVAWKLVQPAPDTGSYLIYQGSMSDEEAQAMLDEQAQASRMTVSLRPVQELVDGKLHVNFVVVPDNNGFSERLEVSQDGRDVYRSGVVEPEHVIEWGTAPLAHPGEATATVYAVDAHGNDFGNPISVEIEIV